MRAGGSQARNIANVKKYLTLPTSAGKVKDHLGFAVVEPLHCDSHDSIFGKLA